MDNMFDDDLKLARRRAEKAIVEDGFLDVKDIKFPRPVIVDEFDEEVSARPQVHDPFSIPHFNQTERKQNPRMCVFFLNWKEILSPEWNVSCNNTSNATQFSLSLLTDAPVLTLSLFLVVL